ncbi:MAG: STAS domain-containing protein, partial [Pseudomonadota bacterium]
MDALVEQTAGTLAESAPLADGTQVYRAVGCWSIRHANTIYDALPKMIAAGPKKVAIDLNDLAILDTSGAWLLCTLRNQYAARGVHVDFVEPREEHTVLLERIARASEAVGDLEPVRTKPESVLDRVAESLKDGIDEVKRILSLLGALVSAFAKALVVPARF